jgi:hypothetical protein
MDPVLGVTAYLEPDFAALTPMRAFKVPQQLRGPHPAVTAVSAMREELHHLVDELPEAEVRPVLELIRGRADAAHGGRDLPFFASFESDPDLAERSEEILRAELGR